MIMSINVTAKVLRVVSSHRVAPVFKNPVKPEDAPDYDDIIYRKMDLNTIKKKIDDGVIY